MLWDETLPNDTPHESFEIHRLKGRIPVKDGRVLLLQGVRNLYDINEAKESARDDDEAKLVLIGRRVGQEAFRQSLVKTLGS